MNKSIVEKLINTAVKKNSSRFVGNPTNAATIDFNFKPVMVALTDFNESNIVTINPIK